VQIAFDRALVCGNALVEVVTELSLSTGPALPSAAIFSALLSAAFRFASAQFLLAFPGSAAALSPRTDTASTSAPIAATVPARAFRLAALLAAGILSLGEKVASERERPRCRGEQHGEHDTGIPGKSDHHVSPRKTAVSPTTRLP